MDVSQQLAVEIFQIARRWRALLDDRLKPAGLTKAGWVVLYWLSRTPDGVTQTELAEKVGIETSTLTRQLDGMESQGLVERRTSPGDRRAKRVCITDAARPLLEQMSGITAAVRTELFDGLADEEIETTVMFLRKLHTRFA
jgi:MarR family transcriptional regulator for hemolysin